MNIPSRSDAAIEKEISQLEKKLKQMGAVLGHRPNLSPRVHLEFLRRVYAFEIKEARSRASAADRN